MIGIYFSGTGNTKYCINQFVKALEPDGRCISIEDSDVLEELEQHHEIIFAYPIYFSNMPKIVRDFIWNNQARFRQKKVYLLVTMGLFSGDGAGCGARLLRRCNAQVTGGLHLKMPDCIGDEKALKKSLEANRHLIERADEKIQHAAKVYVAHQPTREGLGIVAHLAGLLGQRLWFYHKTMRYWEKPRIDEGKCIGCGRCVHVCPMRNLSLGSHIVLQNGRCTLCYRCVNQCPNQALTILGKRVHEQCYVEKYLK